MITIGKYIALFLDTSNYFILQIFTTELAPLFSNINQVKISFSMSLKLALVTYQYHLLLDDALTKSSRFFARKHGVLDLICSLTLYFN